MQAPSVVQAFEGAFAQYNPVYNPGYNPPFATLTLGLGTRAGSLGVLQGRFGWADPDTGFVTNTPVVGGAPYIVQPDVRGGYSRVTFDEVVKAWRIRAGLPVTLFTDGPFWLRFAGGAFVGARVYASNVDGAAISGNTAGATATPWYVSTQAQPGGMAIVTSTGKFGA